MPSRVITQADLDRQYWNTRPGHGINIEQEPQPSAGGEEDYLSGLDPVNIDGVIANAKRYLSQRTSVDDINDEVGRFTGDRDAANAQAKAEDESRIGPVIGNAALTGLDVAAFPLGFYPPTAALAGAWQTARQGVKAIKNPSIANVALTALGAYQGFGAAKKFLKGAEEIAPGLARSQYLSKRLSQLRPSEGGRVAGQAEAAMPIRWPKSMEGIDTATEAATPTVTGEAWPGAATRTGTEWGGKAAPQDITNLGQAAEQPSDFDRYVTDRIMHSEAQKGVPNNPAAQELEKGRQQDLADWVERRKYPRPPGRGNDLTNESNDVARAYRSERASTVPSVRGQSELLDMLQMLRGGR